MLNQIAVGIAVASIVGSVAPQVTQAGPQYHGGPKSFSTISMQETWVPTIRQERSWNRPGSPTSWSGLDFAEPQISSPGRKGR
jgi:hypothetical protein